MHEKLLSSWPEAHTIHHMSNVMTIAEYMEDRRRDIDRYVQGEHAWYGDTSTTLPSLSMHVDPLPWYVK